MRSIVFSFTEDTAVNLKSVTVLGIPPRMGRPEQQRHEYNAFLSQMCDDCCKVGGAVPVRFVDVWTPLIAALGKGSPLLLPDGVHLSGRACWLWAHAIRQIILQPTDDGRGVHPALNFAATTSAETSSVAERQTDAEQQKPKKKAGNRSRIQGGWGK